MSTALEQTSWEKQLLLLENLTWLPWIGENYSIEPNQKVLVIGESHYADGVKGAKDMMNDKNSTRNIVQVLAIDNHTIKFFANIRRAIFGEHPAKPVAFWHSVAFYNFIQRCMIDKHHRPTNEDFSQGWDTFFNLIKVLQPQTCLFAGTMAQGYFWKQKGNSGFDSDGIYQGEKISHTFARYGTLTDNTGKKTELVFIGHPSVRFSWRKWHSYIQQKLPTQFRHIKT